MENNEWADRNDVVLVPLRVAVPQEHEDREKDIDPELEDLKVRSSHCSCRPRDAPSPLLRTLTSQDDIIDPEGAINIAS